MTEEKCVYTLFDIHSFSSNCVDQPAAFDH